MTRFTRRTTLAGLLAAGAVPRLARAADALQVGSYPSNPPFEFKDDAGRFQGFEIDIVHAVAARLGRPVEFTDLGFQALFAATASRRVDMAVSSITVTPARLQNQDFTQPYLDDNLALIAGPASRLKSVEDLKGATVGAIASSTGEAWIKANREKYGIADNKSYDSAANMFLDTANGRVDGTVNDLAGSLYAFKSMTGMRVVANLEGTNSVGIMLGKNSPLTASVNDAVGALKTDGTIPGLYQKWFGTAAPAGSSTTTVVPLPRA